MFPPTPRGKLVTSHSGRSSLQGTGHTEVRCGADPLKTWVCREGATEKALAFPHATWDNIATSHSSGRSGVDCMLRWRNFLRPGLKRRDNGEAVPWTKEEDAQLQEVAKEHAHRNVRFCPVNYCKSQKNCNVSCNALVLLRECKVYRVSSPLQAPPFSPKPHAPPSLPPPPTPGLSPQPISPSQSSKTGAVFPLQGLS